MNKMVGILALVAVLGIGLVSVNSINTSRTSSNSQASSQDFFAPLNNTFSDWELQNNMPRKWNKSQGTSLEKSTDIFNAKSAPYSLKLNSGSITSRDFSMIPLTNGQEDLIIQVDAKKADTGKLGTTISVKRASDKSIICTVKARGDKYWSTWSIQGCKIQQSDQAKPMFFEIVTESGSAPILIDNIGLAENIAP